MTKVRSADAMDSSADDRRLFLSAGGELGPGGWSTWRCRTPRGPGSTMGDNNRVEGDRLAYTNLKAVEKRVDKMLAAESKKGRRRIQKVMAKADLLDHDLRVRLGPLETLGHKEVRRLIKIAGDPRHPRSRQALDRLGEVLPKGRFVSVVTKGGR